MTIATILATKGTEVVSIDAAASMREAVMQLAERKVGAVPVLEGGAVAGVFSERDVIRCVAAHGPSALDRPVSEGMTAPAVSVTPEQSVLYALSLMSRRGIRHLPVLDDGRLIGFVSIGDLVKFRIDRIEAEADAMREYITTR